MAFLQDRHKLKDFFYDFGEQLEKLYFDISEIVGKIPVYVTNIYYPCFDFTNRVSDFLGLKESGQHMTIMKIVDKLNDIIRAKAESYYFGILDINSAFNSKEFYANEIEPSYEGSQLLAELIQRAIRR